jgi:hypothetical protein
MAATMLVAAAGCSGLATVTDPLRSAGSPKASTVGSGVSLADPIVLETHEGLAWVLTDGGTLVSLGPRNEHVVRHLEHEEVRGLHRTPNAKLWALTRDTETDDLRLWSHDAMTWRVVAEWMGMGDPPLALTSSGNRPVVISPRSAFVVDGSELRGVEVGMQLGHPGERALAAATEDGTAYVYERVFKDEGHLSAIDLETGEVSSIVCPTSAEFSVVGPGGERRPCVGITGIVADPTSAACVLVSFRQKVKGGFLWRVCDGSTQIVAGPWEDLGFEEDPARALAPFGDRAPEPETQTRPRPAPMLPNAQELDALCAIDPSSCGLKAPFGPVALLGIAPADDGVWVATADALVAWRPGAVSRFVLRSFNWTPGGPNEERHDLITLKGKTRTLLAAEPTAAGHIENKPPSTACYRATNGDALCLDGNRYRHRSEVADDKGTVLLRPLGDGSYAADVDGGERLTMHFASDRALLVRKLNDGRVGARLALMTEEESRGLLEDGE